MPIVLHEIADPRGRPYSVFCWRTRMALEHKGLAWESRFVQVSDKAAIAFSGQKKVPIVTDGEKVVHDSWRIAEHLEATYPDPSLFGGETGHALARFVNGWADRQLMPVLFMPLMLEAVGLLAPEDAAHIRKTVEANTGRTLEQHAAGKEAAIRTFGRLLDPARTALRGGPYLSGRAPHYADYILFSVLQWARITTPTPVVPADDPVSAWFERMLDLYDGLGRGEPARAVGESMEPKDEEQQR